MSYPALSSTTLSAALAGPTATSAAATRLSVTSSTGMNAYTASTPATVLVIGSEAMTVTAVINSTTVDVERGQQGTTALPHANSTTIYFGNSTSAIGSSLTSLSPAVFTLAAPLATNGLPQFVTTVGAKRMDPNSGYVYMLVDCQAALVNGEWVIIDGNGLASALATGSKGRVGILVEDIAASDTWAWALVEGTYASALFTSGVTTACYLKAGTGCADIMTSTDGNIIFGATCTVAPSTATSPTIGDGLGTAYISNPWVQGVDVSWAS